MPCAETMVHAAGVLCLRIADTREALINSAAPSQRIFFARSMPANPPHSFGYASGLPPQSDRKIYANLTDFILSAIPPKVYGSKNIQVY